MHNIKRYSEYLTNFLSVSIKRTIRKQEVINTKKPPANVITEPDLNKATIPVIRLIPKTSIPVKRPVATPATDGFAATAIAAALGYTMEVPKNIMNVLNTISHIATILNRASNNKTRAARKATTNPLIIKGPALKILRSCEFRSDPKVYPNATHNASKPYSTAEAPKIF